MESTTHIGQKLKDMAESKQMTIPEVAQVFGIKPPSVYEWYSTGRVAKKHYAQLVKWSGKSLNWWFDVPESQHAQMHQINEPVRPYVVKTVADWPFKEFTLAEWIDMPEDQRHTMELMIAVSMSRYKESTDKTARAAHSTL